jgi:1,4-dihydroxy-2-naphthoate octaprenyltransferase
MLNKIIHAGRPQFLIIGLAMYLFGSAWAVLSGVPFSLPRFVFGALVILLAQLSVSYSNEYFDRTVDQPGKTTPFTGGSGVLVANPGLAQVARWLALALIAGSVLAGAAFIWIYAYPWWVILLVVLGNLAGWYYSAPPLRLSARGLGEVCYTLNFGILVPAMGYFSLSGAMERGGLPFVIPLCLYGLASILDVEMPDLEVDREGGKRTWVVRWGRAFGFRVIGGLLLLGTACFFLLSFLNDSQLPRVFYTLGCLSLIPLMPGLFGLVKHPPGREPASRIAIWIMLSLLVFVLLVDAFLIYQATR